MFLCLCVFRNAPLCSHGTKNRCGPIRTGEGAAAQFIGVHILGKNRPAGGFDTLAESRWEDRIGPSIPAKKSTMPQSTVGGLFMVGESAVGRNGGPVCGDGYKGEYLTLGGGRRHGQLVTGLRPLVHHKNTTINLGLARWGLNRPGNGGAAVFCDVHFFGIMAGGGGGVEASLNCDWEDEFDRSARLLASKT